MGSNSITLDADRVAELKDEIRRLYEQENELRSLRQELERELRSILSSKYVKAK